MSNPIFNPRLKAFLADHWKKILLAPVAVTLLAVLLGVVLFFGRQGRTAATPVVPDSLSATPLFDVDEFVVRPETLMLPNIPAELWRGIYTPQQPQKKQWGLADLRRFFYDPQEIGTENLRALNQEKIDTLLKGYQ